MFAGANQALQLRGFQYGADCGCFNKSPAQPAPVAFQPEQPSQLCGPAPPTPEPTPEPLSCSYESDLPSLQKDTIIAGAAAGAAADSARGCFDEEIKASDIQQGATVSSGDAQPGPLPTGLLSCQSIPSGYGKITSKGKRQTREAAESKNQYDNENDTLAYEGTRNECQSTQQEGSSQGTMTEIINLNGNYAASEKLTETQHGKSAESGKGAAVFRKEAYTHFNQIGKACDYEIPEETNLSTGCYASSGFKQ